jgi:outer membrane protein TolC
MKLRFLLSTAFLLSIGSVFGQEGKDNVPAAALKFSLKEAQGYAATNNLNVKNALLDLESAKKKIWETTAIGLPQVTANGNYQYIFKVPKMNFPGNRLTPDSIPGLSYGGMTLSNGDEVWLTRTFGDPIELGVQSNFTWDVTVSQLIFSGEYIVGLQASRVFKELSEKAVTKSGFDTRETVSKAYYLVLVSEENLGILNKSRTLLEKTLQDVTAMNQQGFLEETDVDQVRINKLNIDNLINSVTEQTEIAYRLLKFQMGIDVDQKITLTDSLAGLITQGNLKLWSTGEFEINDNIDYQLMKTQESLSLLSLRREKSKFLPSVNAIYKHQEQLRSASFSFFMPDIIAVGISFPLFSSGMRIAKVKEAELAYQKSTNSRILAEQALYIDYQQSVSSYNKALNDYLSLKESIDLTDRVYNKTLIKYTQGMASSLELTQAQSQFLNSEGNYFSSILNLFTAQAKLEKLLATE